MGGGNAHLFNSVPSRFEIATRLRVSMRDSAFTYVIEPMDPPHAMKTMPDDPFEPSERYAVNFALSDGKCVGQVYVREYWNGMAHVEDIRVAQGFRKMGIGRKLMDEAVAWAREHGFPSVCLESQDNNADACRFYASYGFVLKGADSSVYDSTPYSGETALYWYLPLA